MLEKVFQDSQHHHPFFTQSILQPNSAQGVKAMVSESKFQVTIKTQNFTNSVASEITSLFELQVSYLQNGAKKDIYLKSH